MEATINWPVGGFIWSWLKAFDRQDLRVRTQNKIPLRKNWTKLNEKTRVEKLLKIYGEYGARTGKKVGNKYLVITDLDLKNCSLSLLKIWDRNYLLMTRRQKVKSIKTKNGYHVILLLDELPPNGIIYHTDKFGVQRKIGDILSAGRQVQGIGSLNKVEFGKGKWVWQAKNIEEVAKIWSKYFFEFELSQSTNRTLKLTSETPLAIKTTQKSKIAPIFKAFFYKKIKLEQVQIKGCYPYKNTRNYLRVHYVGSQGEGYFLLDWYYRDKTRQVKPELKMRELILNQGYKHNFYYWGAI